MKESLSCLKSATMLIYYLSIKRTQQK